VALFFTIEASVFIEFSRVLRAKFPERKPTKVSAKIKLSSLAY